MAEAQGEPVLEMRQGLSLEGRVSNSQRATVSSARGRGEKMAMVTARFKPFTLNGKTVHEVEGLKTT